MMTSRLWLACVVLLMGAMEAGGLAGCSRLQSRRVAPGPAIKGGDVVFRFWDPTARRVQLAGSWQGNNWTRGDGSVGEANIGLMVDDDADGIWEIQITLPPGRYRYLFLVDENIWRLDPGNPEQVEGGPPGICSQIILYRSHDRLEIR